MPIAYVSAQLNRLDPDPDLDWPIFHSACEKIGLAVELTFWDDPKVIWSNFELAVIRSPWNYSDRRDAFVRWAYETEAKIPLLNSAKTIDANTDKRYLLDLAKQISVIDTWIFAQDQNPEPLLLELLEKHKAIAIKPHIGAGAQLAKRVESIEAAFTAIAKIHNQQRLALVQPYLQEVDEQGEIAIVLIAGEISHAVKKVPALTVGGHGDAHSEIQIDDQLREFVQKVKSSVSGWDELLYARIDVVPTDSGFKLMELELTEPTLFFPQHPSAAERLVEEIRNRLSR